MTASARAVEGEKERTFTTHAKTTESRLWCSEDWLHEGRVLFVRALSVQQMAVPFITKYSSPKTADGENWFEAL